MTNALMSDFYSIRAAVKPRTSVVVEVLLGTDDVHILLCYDPEQGILRAFGEGLLEHARCADCDDPLREDFSECGCGIVPDDLPWFGFMEGNALRVEPDIWRNILDPLWAKDKRRAYSIVNRERRKAAIEASEEPSYKKRDITCLQKAQGDACYYCGKSISDGFHIDHLESLARGGSNAFANIMLACASCNMDKGSLDERLFWRRLEKKLPAEEYDRRRSAAKEMKKAKWRIYRERIRKARKPRFEI